MLRAKTVDGDTATVPLGVVNTIEALEEEDLVVVNDDTRTWEVTDIVDREFGSDDDRVSKRAVRMRNPTGHGEEPNVFALILEEYPNGYEAGFHVLSSTNWYEEDRIYRVESVTVLETLIPWVVVRLGAATDTYHFPDPWFAARGEAAPACGGQPGEDVAEVDHRLVRVNVVYPAKRACMDCARRHRPREVPKLNCPECGHGIGLGLLHGKSVTAVEGVAIECPGRDCDFEGVVDLAE